MINFYVRNAFIFNSTTLKIWLAGYDTVSFNLTTSVVVNVTLEHIVKTTSFLAIRGPMHERSQNVPNCLHF